jgi:hypothetical protein
MLFILSHKKKTKYTVRATLSVDESYKADGTHSILRGVRVWVVYLTMHILSS